MTDVGINIYNAIISIVVLISLLWVISQDDYPVWLKASGAIGVLLIGALLIVGE